LGDKLQSTQLQIDCISKQLVVENKATRKNTFDNSKIQMMESNIEFLFERLDTLTEGQASRSGNKSCHNGDSSDRSHYEVSSDRFEREIRSLRTELKLEMTELTNGFCSLEEELQDYSKQLKQKVSMADLDEALEELRERSNQSSTAIDRINSSLYELNEERENT